MILPHEQETTTFQVPLSYTKSQSKCTFSFNGITPGMAQAGKPMPPFDGTLVSGPALPTFFLQDCVDEDYNSYIIIAKVSPVDGD